MTTIQKDSGCLTLVNVFHVKPENQAALVELLTAATETTMQHQPGFISANIHRSLDGTRVINYAQWQSRQDFEAMKEVEEVKPHIKQAGILAEHYDPVLCEVSSIHNV